MDREVIDIGLKPTSTIAERINAFLESGLPSAVIVEALGVSERTLRNWKNGITQPRQESERTVDDIRFVMGAFVFSNGLEPDKAANIIQRRFIAAPHERFIDLIARNPEHAIELIVNLKSKKMRSTSA